jgi:TetR/AcrR family acrAB operon transcriptional repressor
MARKTKAEAQATRQAVLDAALTVFSRQGFAAARLEDVAAEAGLTRGAIYWHFPSKAALYQALLADASARIEQVIGAARAEGAGSVLETTRRVMVRMLTYLEEDATYCAVQALLLLKTGVSADLDMGRAEQLTQLHTKERELADILRYGIQTGVCRPDLAPEEGARAMLAYLDGITLHWLLDPGAFSLTTSAPELIDIYVRGIMADGGRTLVHEGGTHEEA